MVPSRPCSTAGEPAQFVFVARGQMFRLVGRPTGIGRRFVAVASAVDRSCWRMRGNLMAVLHGTWPLIFCGCAYVLCCFCGYCRRLMPAGPPCALLDFGLWCTGVAGIDGWVACCPAGLERRPEILGIGTSTLLPGSWRCRPFLLLITSPLSGRLVCFPPYCADRGPS